MNKFLITLLLLLQFSKTFSCCIEDNRNLPQYLIESKDLTIFSCKIMSTITDSNQNVFSKAVVMEIFFGQISTKQITLYTGSHNSSTGASNYLVGSQMLVYTNGKGNYFYCGGICDNRTHRLDGVFSSKNEMETLRLFSKIYTKKKSGIFTFRTSDGKILSSGSFEKGEPVNLWKHYDYAGRLKVEYDYTSKNTTSYDNDGFVYSLRKNYSDSTVYLSFAAPKQGFLRMKEVDFPNDSGFVSVFYEYYPNGKLRSIEGQVNLKSSNNISSWGKIGKCYFFYENGKLKYSGEYRKDKRIGIWKWYDENGAEYAIVDYKDGSLNQ